RHGPATMLCQRHDGLHVDLIDVRALLAVHFDVYEEPIHEVRDPLVLERLPLHDVTPVTSRISNREKHRAVLSASALQGLLAPRIPVHGVVRVLAEIGAGLTGEPVGVLVLGHALAPWFPSARRTTAMRRLQEDLTKGSSATWADSSVLSPSLTV